MLPVWSVTIGVCCFAQFVLDIEYKMQVSDELTDVM